MAAEVRAHGAALRTRSAGMLSFFAFYLFAPPFMRRRCAPLTSFERCSSKFEEEPGPLLLARRQRDRIIVYSIFPEIQLGMEKKPNPQAFTQAD